MGEDFLNVVNLHFPDSIPELARYYKEELYAEEKQGLVNYLIPALSLSDIIVNSVLFTRIIL